MLLLLGTLGVGILMLSAERQQGETQSIADYAAANPGDGATFAESLTTCPATIAPGVSGATVAALVCPTWVGGLLPGILPAFVTTSATAWQATPTPTPTPEPSLTP